MNWTLYILRIFKRVIKSTKKDTHYKYSFIDVHINTRLSTYMQPTHVFTQKTDLHM